MKHSETTLIIAFTLSCSFLIPGNAFAGKLYVGTSIVDIAPALNATHTHTAPVLRENEYAVPVKGVTQVETYRQFFAEKIANCIAKAWNQRAEASVAWGLSLSQW